MSEISPMKKPVCHLFLIAFLALALGVPSFGQWFVDYENGLALSGYNDVEIPRETGTRFSLSKDLKTDPGFYFRVRIGYQWKNRHTISVFASPFRLKAKGSVAREIFFFEETFPANVPLTGAYKFNSFRLTYRFDFARRGRLRAGVGLTAKIRDAFIKIEGDGLVSNKTNVGFVPLINFRVLWQFADKWSLLFEGDAAAASQGRAEDVLLALQVKLNERLTLRAGYRILEGGADVEEVYNFALIHFLGAGLTYTF